MTRGGTRMTGYAENLLLEVQKSFGGPKLTFGGTKMTFGGTKMTFGGTAMTFVCLVVITIIFGGLKTECLNFWT